MNAVCVCQHLCSSVLIACLIMGLYGILGVCVHICVLVCLHGTGCLCVSAVCLFVCMGSWVCSEQRHAGREPGGLPGVADRRRGSHQLWPRLSLAHPLHTLLLRLLVSAHLQGFQVSDWYRPQLLAQSLCPYLSPSLLYIVSHSPILASLCLALSVICVKGATYLGGAQGAF